MTEPRPIPPFDELDSHCLECNTDITREEKENNDGLCSACVGEFGFLMEPGPEPPDYCRTCGTEIPAEEFNLNNGFCSVVCVEEFTNKEAPR